MKHRASGGRMAKEDDDEPASDAYAGANSNVRKEADGKRTERKFGGKVGAKTPTTVAGAPPRHHRLDRPGRKRGGAIGADTSPLTAANKLKAPEGGSMKMPKLDAADD